MLARERESDSPTTESAVISDEVNNHLQAIIGLLGNEVEKLVLDAKEIRVHLEALQGLIPESVEEPLIPAAFIEGHRFQVLKAQRRLADRIAQEKILKDKEKHLTDANSIDDQIGVLSRNQARQKEKTDLQNRRASLVQEIAQIDESLADIEDDLQTNPNFYCDPSGKQEKPGTQSSSPGEKDKTDSWICQ